MAGVCVALLGGTQSIASLRSPCAVSSLPTFWRYMAPAVFQMPLMKERLVTSDIAPGSGATDIDYTDPVEKRVRVRQTEHRASAAAAAAGFLERGTQRRTKPEARRDGTGLSAAIRVCVLPLCDSRLSPGTQRAGLRLLPTRRRLLLMPDASEFLAAPAALMGYS